MPQISIVIPSTPKRGSLRSLKRCLLSCLQQDLPSTDFEVIVVLNPSSPEADEIVQALKQEYPRIHFLSTQEKGVNRARNLGTKHAKGSWIYFLDDDCRFPTRSHLENAMRLIRLYPDLHGVGGHYISGISPTLASRFYNEMCNLWLEFHKSIPLGGNLILKRDLFLRRYQFNEKMKWGGTETELLTKLSQDHYKLKTFRELAIVHEPKTSLPGIFRKAWLQGINRRYQPGKTSIRDALNDAGFPFSHLPLLGIYFGVVLAGNSWKTLCLRISDLFSFFWIVCIRRSNRETP